MPLRVLSVHNFYQQPGGEDRVFASESAILETHGHTVFRYEEHNARIDATGAVSAGIDAVWSRTSKALLAELVRAERPDVAHFHNTFPLISPSAYYAMRENRVPVVQELQNFRLVCPGGTFLREGQVCEDCARGRSLAPAIQHGCYRQSRAATAAVASMLTVHRALRTWTRMVDAYIAPSEFVQRKFVEYGFPPEKIAVKPNPVLPDPGPGDGAGGYALFVGRLAEEKGIRTLAKAWLRLTGIPLVVVGEGPLASIDWPADITVRGALPYSEVLKLMKSARTLVIPSTWYETGPLTLIEALACGLPPIVSDLGSMSERVEHHRTGLLFRPGDPEDLAAKVRWAFDHPVELQQMRVAARREYELNYTAEVNYKRLIEIYELAIENHARMRRTTGLGPRKASVLPILTAAEAPSGLKSAVRETESRHILGVRVEATTYADATRQILDWARESQSRYVCCASVNNIMEAHDSPEFRGVMNGADLVTSDGMPLVWLLRLLGIRKAGRVYGPDLTRHVLRAAEQADVPVAFFGGSEEVLAALLRRVEAGHPALRIVYAESPPFRASTVEEDARTIDGIVSSGARIVFVGLSTPKQDRWMHAHREKIQGVMLGVGAAFDFLAGTKPQASKWMQSSGLEWLFRLATEPRRLWRRYLRHNPRFAVLAVGQLLRTRHP
jgi:exopolysaccharide biosynthesis WecB/TagA/CpsF family protein